MRINQDDRLSGDKGQGRWASLQRTTVVVLLLFLICSFGCSERIVQHEDVFFYAIQEKADGHDVVLEISGHVLHSSMGVERIETRIKNDEAQINVYIALVRKDIDGNVFHSFVVPRNVNRVFFGPERHLIWQRNAE